MKIEKIFLFLATLFIALFMFLVPVTQVPDETTHAIIAWDITHDAAKEDSLQWLAKHQMEVISNKSSVAPAVISNKKLNRFFTEKKDFSNAPIRLKVSLKNLAHLPQLIGMYLGRMIYSSYGIIFLMGRLVNALVYIIGVYFVIKSAKYGKLALMFISLMPMMLQQAASLSYDVLNYVAVASFFVFFVNLIIERKFTSKKLVQLILLALFMYSTKVNNLVLIPFLAVVDFEFEGILKVFNPTLKLFQRYRWYIVSFIIMIGFILFYLYLKGWGGTQHFIWVMFNTFFLQQENVNLNGLLTIGIFGQFGWLTTQLPLWLIFVDIVALILVFGSESLELNKGEVISTALVFPIQVFVIVVGMYFAWTLKSNPENVGANRIAHGEQGRYFTPFLIYLSPLFSGCKSKLDIRVDRKFLIKFTVALLIMNVAIAFSVLLAYYWV